ncbi:TauD/TfdA family dioxygenase [Nocardiopsis sp. EMB25]|uniref:TauD/TfdA family dioxygenase n=1 Tax=Nocardiopsis sp. EMB25 TaxID=2835867 RepID=UPI00228522F4|nr:TauD/TfdA family dioxygenase [Nocardiopsis sp. EMB25]MCY9787129.1 TauD/TfdA family dioxygenase [Nocardiopsis sp. EMB25]
MSLPVVEVDIDHALLLAQVARDLDTGPTAHSTVLAEAGAAAVGCLPMSLLRALHQIATVPSLGGVLLVRGLLPSSLLTDLEPTPSTALPGPLGPAARAAGLALLTAMTPLGAPFTFASLYEGRLVQHVVPVPGEEEAQTSTGSDSLLSAHVEDAFTEQRCDAFGLLCLRGHPGAATTVSRAVDLRLDREVEQVLREPRWRIAPDLAHGTAQRCAPARPVLTGPADDPAICYDALYQHPADDGDTEAMTAWKAFGAELERVALAHVLEPGELLVVDNRRVVHGRTRFTPRFDGTDRWLLRAMVTADRRTHRAAGSPRALTEVSA